ncbi:unnamed protein product [Larinioides sclopetarius]|uniref:Uncharacterized protein n=1 Tax=Larinioides sclopetarius TaxID=280406 RepID=A0AAV2ACY6_9ARAC
MESSWSDMMEAFDHTIRNDDESTMDFDETVSKQFKQLNLKPKLVPMPIDSVIGVLVFSDFGESYYFRTVTHHLLSSCKGNWIDLLIEILKECKVRELILVGRRVQDILEPHLPTDIVVFHHFQDYLRFPCSTVPILDARTLRKRG